MLNDNTILDNDRSLLDGVGSSSEGPSNTSILSRGVDLLGVESVDCDVCIGSYSKMTFALKTECLCLACARSLSRLCALAARLPEMSFWVFTCLSR